MFWTFDPIADWFPLSSVIGQMTIDNKHTFSGLTNMCLLWEGTVLTVLTYFAVWHIFRTFKSGNFKPPSKYSKLTSQLWIKFWFKSYFNISVWNHDSNLWVTYPVYPQRRKYFFWLVSLFNDLVGERWNFLDLVDRNFKF